ncbi:MAG: DUF4157 domain-containing protein [Kofleriaceae bacterium]
MAADRISLKPAAPGGAAVQRKASGAAGGKDVHATAAAGVRDASSALPYASMIQQSFGRHEIGGVKAAVGGAATAATAAIGATAYATGDRVAFGGAPDLHTAAHEAAHVVQQRSGVQLAGGVGSSGDRYEQHADRVADRVVSGGSAESLLDEMTGGGGSSQAVQRHDSPSHIAIGDSVQGEKVYIHGVPFTAGQISALADYVTSVDGLETRFTICEVSRMHDLLVAGIEDTNAWNIATNGEYGDEVEANEKHFAPSVGDGGANFRSQFITGFASGLAAVASGDITSGRALGYGAEHYMQDAFSAGHQLAARDVEREVDEVLNLMGEAVSISFSIAGGVYAAKAHVIRCYDVAFGDDLFGHPIEALDFAKIAAIGGAYKRNAGVADAVRRFVHERLETGVEVTSKAHPMPFTLLGDHDIDGEGGTDALIALQTALHEGRGLLEAGAPQASANTIATTHFDNHCPIPTATGGATIRDAIEAGTQDSEAIIAAVVKSMCETIEDVMDTLVDETHSLPAMLLLRVTKAADPENGPPNAFPVLDPFEPGAPVVGQPVEQGGSYVPDGPRESYVPDAPVQKSEGTATATTATSAPTQNDRMTPTLGELSTGFPLLQETTIPTPYGNMVVKANLSGTVDLAPKTEGETGLPTNVSANPTEVAAETTGVLAAALGRELGIVADKLTLKSTGSLEYALGFNEVALPGFGPLTQKFQFQLVEATTSLTKLPEVKFGTFTLTGTLAVPPQYDVGGSIAIELKLEPNWWAIARTLLAQTAKQAVAGAATEAAAGGAAAGGEAAGVVGGAGLGLAPVAVGAVGAAIVVRLIAEAYVNANGHDPALESAYIGGYSTGLASEIFQVFTKLPEFPPSAIKEQMTVRQYEGVTDAERVLATIPEHERAAVREEYTYSNFKGSVEAQLRLALRN